MKRARAGLLFVAVTACAALASAQPGRRPEPAPVASAPAPTASPPTNVRARVGTERASRLLASSDPDERIRGIARLASIGTPEALAALIRAAESGATVRSDSRALVAAARALARFTDNERARAALLSIVNVGNPASLVGRMPRAGRTADALLLEEGDPALRTELARETAAIALARSGVDRALEQLYGVARGGGSGQTAAMIALALSPPRDPGFFGTAGPSMPAAVVRMLGQLGDLRALELLHTAARSSDVTVRGSAIVSIAELGDHRAIPLARAAIAESDARLRAAAGEAFVLLSAPERFKAVAALVSDDATAALGIRLAERVTNAEITNLLVARAHSVPAADGRDIRAAAIRALGRSPDPEAAKALVSPRVLGDPGLQYDAALALARSPAPNAGDLASAIAAGNLKTLGVRAYVVRALLRGERKHQGDAAVTAMLESKVPRERALAVFAKIALGDARAEDWIADKEPRVRRAAAMAALARPSRDLERALLARLRAEPDDTTRQLLAVGLLEGDPDGLITTTALVDRAEAGGVDAPLAAFALSHRADDATARKVGQLLASKDPLVRAHAARGLGVAPLADASGRLASAYAYETDVEVRRAIVAALAARTRDGQAPSRKDTLELASQLDPDGTTRQAARLAEPPARPALRDVAWLRVTLDGGAPPGDHVEPYAGMLVRPDGVAVPIVFDEEGYALVPGLPPGEARLVLAPRLPSYEASKP